MNSNIEITFKDIQKTINQMKELARLNKLDLLKIMQEQNKEVTKKQAKTIKHYKNEYEKLHKDRLKNNMKLLDINSKNNDIDIKIDYIGSIIEEIEQKKNNKIQLDYLEQFINI